jgi:hypothetical protein
LATVTVVSLLLFYVLSFSPACWLLRQGVLPARATCRFYRPLVIGGLCNVTVVADPLRWYAGLLVPHRHRASFLEQMYVCGLSEEQIRGIELRKE